MGSNNELRGYQGVFLDKESEQRLIALQDNHLSKIIDNMHITFKSGIIEKYPNELMGKKFNIRIRGYGSDDKNSGFSIIIPNELRRYYKSSMLPHVAVSIEKKYGISGVIEDTSNLDFKELDEPISIRGMLGYYIYDRGICMENSTINKYIMNNQAKDIKIILIPHYMSQNELQEANIFPMVTIGAEYGEEVIEGRILTYSLKKDNQNSIETYELEDGDTIVVRSLDIRTLSIIAKLIGRTKISPFFWKSISFIIEDEPCNLFKVDEDDRIKYLSYKAYQINHQIPQNTEYIDITDVTRDYLDIIDRIADGDSLLIQEGIRLNDEIMKKSENCLVFENRYIRAFEITDSEECTRSFYSQKQGKIIPCVIIRNIKNNNIIIAIADREVSISARELAKEIWGNEAGGLPEIAGSPKGKKQTKEDLQQVVRIVNSKFNKIEEMDDVIFFDSDENSSNK